VCRQRLSCAEARKILSFDRNPIEAAAQEKTFHLSSKRLALDDRYILYALNRKAKQDSKSSTLGQDGMRAIDLMEFDAGMEKARRYHMQCVSSMKGFWRLLSRKTIKANAVDEMLKKLDDWDSAVTTLHPSLLLKTLTQCGGFSSP